MANETSPLMMEEQQTESKLGESLAGDRLPYSDYATIDWLHDLVKDSYRHRAIRARKGFRARCIRIWDSASGWIAAAIIGILTAAVAYVVDMAVPVLSDFKLGYCTRNILLNREKCCQGAQASGALVLRGEFSSCTAFREWSTSKTTQSGIFIAIAVLFGTIACSLTMLTKRSFSKTSPLGAKSIYMAAGSGIPEIKTVLSGFVIPHLLSLDVLVVKAVGAMFAVSAGLCLGKEGPFVHISACVGSLVANRIPKYANNGREMRYMLSVACAAGLGVAFGAPIGGVLFSFEEISTYFPRKVLWRAFLCSLLAAMVLKELDPTGTGRLILFETSFSTHYDSVQYLIFLALGVAGGIFGGCFCKANFLWSKWFRSFKLIKNYPVFEAFLITAVTAAVQFPNPLTRVLGESTIKQLLADCNPNTEDSWVCTQEADPTNHKPYILYLIYGTIAKLLLTIITFGIKVPSGVIIPALSAGALFGRLIGVVLQSASHSPGVFAMVGAAAFLAGVSRMTISLCVIMFELTGEAEYVVPSMLAILVAKFVADAIGREGVYDLAQTLIGHPFLDLEGSMELLKRQSASTKGGVVVAPPALADVLIPPEQTMNEITVRVPSSGCVAREVLVDKLRRLRARGLTDAGLVLVQESTSLALGYIAQSELEFGLRDPSTSNDVRLFGLPTALEGQGPGGMLCLSSFVDRTPLCLCSKAPLEYAIELFGKLGLRYLILTEECTGAVIGVVIKKRVIAYLDSLEE